MPADLAAVLPPARRSDCREQMRRRANYDYSDEHPHDAASIASLDECLAEVERRLRSRRTDLLTEDRLQMVAEFRRAIARDFLPFAELVTRRDKGMYENLRWLMNHAGSHRKAIVWTANGHAAKGTGISDEYDTGPNLGSLVHRALGSRAFALGISAASGSYYRGRKEPARPMPNAAPESLEVRALEGTTSEQVYVNASQLGKLGPAPGSFSHHVPRTERWDQLFDCAMILRAERPPVREP
jgi:erythromycin esterase-like protein